MDYKKINDGFYSSNFWGIDRSKYKWFSKYVKARVFTRFLEKVPDKDVLYDAGGGVGNWGAYFSKYFKKTIVSDISKIALDRIPEKEIVKLQCSVLKNKLPDRSVDCILLIDVFEHIDEKDLPKMLTDFVRILRPNGKIFILTNHYGWGLGLILQRIFNPKKRLLGDEHLGGHVNRLKYSEFKNLFQESGLRIEDYCFYSFIFQQITDLIKDDSTILVSRILGKRYDRDKLGREGQYIKENLRSKEKSIFLRVPLFLFSYLSYLDVLIFGRLKIGNSIFFCLGLDKK
jgi:SAM-dependent methyltransferase